MTRRTEDLHLLLLDPKEDLSVEYKTWLDLRNEDHKAVLAKASIALANHGGGFIVLGFDDGKGLTSAAKPDEVVITQDLINGVIQKYASPAFHCRLDMVPHPGTRCDHPIITIPGGHTEPVMSTRHRENIIANHRCYMRKPGPRSEEPKTAEEWRTLLTRCVRSTREDLLEAIRSIVTGRVDAPSLLSDELESLRAFCEASRARWVDLASDLAPYNEVRFPHGHYEMAFSILSASPASSLNDLKDRLELARAVKLSGWTPFLALASAPPYPHDNFIENWIGDPRHQRGIVGPAFNDYWRASPEGQLYTIRGYYEDGPDYSPKTLFDFILPIIRLAEGLLFARRLAEQYAGATAIAIYCRFNGLDGRKLTRLHGIECLIGDYLSRTSEFSCEMRATLAQIDDNLVEVMHQLLAPLYERFDLFKLEIDLVQSALDDLRLLKL